MIGENDIGGVHIKYLYHCRRQLWLYGHGIRPERGSELVQLGEAVHDTTYRRTVPVDLGPARLDFVDGENWVHEVKSSRGPTGADKAQVMHYCYRLREVGIEARGGILHYPATRRTQRVEYTSNEETTARTDIRTALDVLLADQSPARIAKTKCRGCSFLEYCWTAG